MFPNKIATKTIIASWVLVQLAGCSALSLNEISPGRFLRPTDEKSSGNESNSSGAADGKIANPPAKTLRFDGHEIVLGQSESQMLDTQQLLSRLEPLVQQQRMHSAATLIRRHRESAERLLSERWATDSDEPVIRLVAGVLSRRSTQSGQNWTTLLDYAKQNNRAALQYQNLRNAFAVELQNEDPSGSTAEQLMQASLKVAHPLVRLDALRLLGLRDLVAGRHAWAESHFRQAIEIAASSGNSMIAADLWLMVAESARRGKQSATSATAWSNAVNLHMDSSAKELPLDVSFWLLADKTRPESIHWPSSLSSFLTGHVQPLGCSTDGGSEMMLWISIAQARLERGELQAALVNFKKAETLAEGANRMWLRIAQAKCLAAMGQSPAAAAILSGPAASSDAAIAAAATAAMGSIKLQSGAYQQGAQLLHKALTHSPLANWPGRVQAQVDLALAQLIFGDTDTGLLALHDAQALLEQSGERSLLIQSLENELRLLEFENRVSESTAIQSRIAQLERL